MNEPQFSFIKNLFVFVFFMFCFVFVFLSFLCSFSWCFYLLILVSSCSLCLLGPPHCACCFVWLGAFLVVAIHWHSSSCFLCLSNIFHHILFVATTN